MSLKHHFKFHIFDAKQLTIAMTGAFSTWAATGFQRDMPHLGYVLVGFITGGLVSHNSSYSPGVMPDSHIETPYANNLNDKSNDVPKPTETLNENYKAEGTDVKQVIKINSGLIK
jgi:hypothetical protein